MLQARQVNIYIVVLKSVFSRSAVSEQQSLDLRRGCFVSPQCTNLCSLGCIGLHQLHYSVAGVSSSYLPPLEWEDIKSEVTS